MGISSTLFFSIAKLWNLVPAKLTIVVVIISFSVGKIQPFSTFPVYSHIPPVSEYYYMTDEKDLIIPIALKFDYDGGSLHKMIEYRYVQYSKTYGDPEILNKVGLETLDYLFETFAITSETVSYKQIKIWNAKVKMMNDQIVVVHKEIAKMQVL